MLGSTVLLYRKDTHTHPYSGSLWSENSTWISVCFLEGCPMQGMPAVKFLLEFCLDFPLDMWWRYTCKSLQSRHWCLLQNPCDCTAGSVQFWVDFPSMARSYPDMRAIFDLFLRNCSSILQRNLKEIQKKGNNSAQKQFFKNLRKPFLFIFT